MKKYRFLLLIFTISTFQIFGQATAADLTKWNLPDGAFARIGKGIVTDIAYSPDGKHLAVATYIGVWIYDTHTGTEKALLTVNTGNVTWEVVYSPDGQTLAVLQRDLLLWDTQTYTLKGTLKGHSHSVTDVVFSPNGKTIAIADMDQTTQLWDVNTMALKCTLEGSTCDYNHEGMVMFSVAFDPIGDMVAIASEDGTIRLWDTATGILKQTLIGYFGFGDSFSFSPDGKTIATESFSNALLLWDTTTGRIKSTFRTFTKGPVVYSPDGNKIATIRGSYIILWDAVTGQMQGILETGPVRSFLFSPDGNNVAIVKKKGTNIQSISLWNTAGNKPYEFTPIEECGNSLYSDIPVPAGNHKYTFGDANWSVEGMTFSPDGHTFAMVNPEGNVQLWNTETGELRHTLKHSSPVIDVSFSKFSNFKDSSNRNNNLIIVHSNNNVRLWNTNTRLYKHTFELTKHSNEIRSASYNPDGNTLVTACSDGNLNLWRIPSGLFKGTLGKHRELFLGPFSPDGNTLAIREGKKLKIFEIATTSLKNAFNAIYYVRCMAYSPDGKTIAIGMQMKKIVELWKITGEKIHRIECDYQLRNVTFSPDGNTLAIGLSYNTLLYNAKTLIRKHTIDEDGTILKFSLDGKTLANGGSNGTILLSDTETWTEKNKLTGHVGTVTSVAFSADSNTIATASKDGTVLLWNQHHNN